MLQIIKHDLKKRKKKQARARKKPFSIPPKAIVVLFFLDGGRGGKGGGKEVFSWTSTLSHSIKTRKNSKTHIYSTVKTNSKPLEWKNGLGNYKL